jgi:16S rRNA C967 or C1407 C5-methylase (RsmB/RsmF family)
MITAVEKNKKRYERLKYNLDKLGVKKCSVINKDARYLDDFYSFDKILLDTPCSGTGTLDDINKFDEELLLRINNIQIELIDKAIKLLKSNGILVYSTCSILNKENEDVIDYILNKYDDIELVNIDKDIFKDIELLPSKYKEILKVLPSNEYEGFFVAKFIKK